MNIVNTKVLLNGPRNAVVSVYFRSDGASGELENYTLVDPEVTLGMAKKSRLMLLHVAYNFAGFDGVLEFASGGVTPNFKWVLSESANYPLDLSVFGGLIDDSGLDGQSKLQISTTGFTASTDQGSLILVLKTTR